eukprot:11493787-Alexandrium_andersonii.AAC.1
MTPPPPDVGPQLPSRQTAWPTLTARLSPQLAAASKSSDTNGTKGTTAGPCSAPIFDPFFFNPL